MRAPEVADLIEGERVEKRPVERIPAGEIGREEFTERFRDGCTPVVLEGVLEETPQWTLASMGEVLGDDEFVIRVYGKGHFDAPKVRWERYADFRPMPFREYAEGIRSGWAAEERAYLAQMPIEGSPLVDDLRDALEGVGERYGLRPWMQEAVWNLWLGPSGHTEPLHFDNGDGTLLQLHGRKRVDLFPSDVLFDLYPFGYYDTLPPWVSRVNLDRVDLTRFPRARRALDHWHQAVLEPGDLLFIPVGWPHEVTGIDGDFVCSLNRFWKPEPLRNHFRNARVGAFYFINKLPWGMVLKVHGVIDGLRRWALGAKAPSA